MFKKLNRIRFFQILIYFLVRYIAICLSIIGSFSTVQDIGKLFGLIMYLLDKRHRDIAIQNIKNSSLSMNHAKTHETVKKVYEHLGITFAELAIAQDLSRKKQVSKHVIISGLDNINKALSKGGGAILILGHLGNWELAGIAFSQRGYNITSVARPLDNPYLDRYLRRARQISGQKIIEKWDAFKHVQMSLRNNGVVAILVDQDAKDEGVFVDFFGRKASTIKSAALLSLRCKTPIIPTNIFRDGLIHHLIFTTPIYPGKSDINERQRRHGVSGTVGATTAQGAAWHHSEIIRITQEFTDRIEKFIREHPDQWFWLHRRWKTQPLSAAAPGRQAGNVT